MSPVPLPKENSDAGLAWDSVEATLQEVASINPRDALTDAKSKQLASFVPMAAVSELSGHIDLSQTRPVSTVAKGYTRFRDGDLLFAKITPCMENGKIAIAKDLVGGIGFGSTEFHVLRAKEGVLAEYLFYYLTQSRFRNEAQHNMKGTAGQKRVPADFLARCKIPLVSTAEQERIVAKIDELFSDLDAGVAALERARALLVQYRQSILKAAIAGELSRTWRERHRGGNRNGRTSGTLTSNETSLPAGWQLTTLGKLSRDSSYGTSEKCKYENAGSPVLRIPNIVDGKIVLGDLKRADASFSVPEANWIMPGDFLIIRTNGSVNLIGRGALATDPMPEPSYFASYLIRFRLTGSAELQEWVNLIWNAPTIREWIMARAATSAGQHNVSQKTLAQVPIPLPSDQELAVIVEECRRRLESIRDLDNLLAQMEADTATQRQSILAAAFAGKLVPQDPGDGSASALLARIRAQRAAAPQTTRRRSAARKPTQRVLA